MRESIDPNHRGVMKMFEDFIRLLSTTGDPSNVFTALGTIVVLSFAYVLCLIVAYTYRATHNGISYSQSFVHTIVMMGVIVSAIMLIIGSNIARAFTLVGALSIVRFRNAVKESRDVIFIFFSMSVGMACGTRFYLVAVILTFMVSLMIYLMTKFNFGAKKVYEELVKIRLPENSDYHTVFNHIFHEYLSYFSLISVESIDTEKLNELVYLVEFKESVKKQDFLDAIRRNNDNNKVTILHGEHVVDI